LLLFGEDDSTHYFLLGHERPCNDSTHYFLIWRRGQYTLYVENARTYQPAYQIESTVFFSHNKTDSAGLSAGLCISRTEQAVHCPLVVEFLSSARQIGA